MNSAEVDELMKLPGVGPVLAEAIVSERQQNGLFYYPEDLLNVRGIGEKTLEKLLPYVNFQ
ncbi:MAG: helix-hairpin-helix domain-containing protein [Clostridia bacterium]|nr:helix-hairpin-helix domain-containing protein [Clostridia bacterium]